MDWFTDLFTQHSAIQAVVVLSLISVFGMMLGKVRFFGISLGVTFVFFIGIAAGHFGLSVDPSMLAFAESFGLVLFVYALGLQVGPGFFSSLRSGGIRLVSLATLIVLTGSALAVGLGYATRVPMSDMAGILCGATTNTPALGAAQQMLSQMQLDSNNATLGCALTYPLGVVGVILGIIAVRKLFARPSDIPQPDAEHKKNIFIVEFKISNPGVVGKSIRDVAAYSHHHFVISRLWRAGQVSIPTSDSTLESGDLVLVITSPDDVQALELLFGERVQKDWNTHDIDWNALDSQLISRSIIVTRPEINGRKLSSLRLRNLYGINISRVHRSGVQLLATPDLTLQLGDSLTVVGEAQAIEGVEKILGNAVKQLDEPNLIPVFIGLLLGLLLGSIPFAVPGISLPVKLGLAGGPIILGILIGTFGPRHPHRHLHHVERQPDAPGIGTVALSGLPGARSGRPFRRNDHAPRRNALDRTGIPPHVRPHRYRSRPVAAVLQTRFRTGSRHHVRQHGQPDGAELCQRLDPRRSSGRGVRDGLSRMHVPAGHHHSDSDHVLYLAVAGRQTALRSEEAQRTEPGTQRPTSGSSATRRISPSKLGVKIPPPTPSAISRSVQKRPPSNSPLGTTGPSYTVL